MHKGDAMVSGDFDHHRIGGENTGGSSPKVKDQWKALLMIGYSGYPLGRQSEDMSFSNTPRSTL